MPQIKLEYSSNLELNFSFDELFSEIHRILADVGNINKENCKSRAHKADDYFVGDGNSNNTFVHLELSIFEGREEEIKRKIGWEIMKVLQDFFFSAFSSTKIQITLEIREFSKSNYFKIPRNFN